MTENIAPEDKTGLTIFSRNNRKAHYEMKKYVKKCPFAPPNGHLSVKSEPLFPKKILYLRHERNIRNHTKDRTPLIIIGVAALMLGVIFAYLFISGNDIHHIIKPLVFSGVNLTISK